MEVTVLKNWPEIKILKQSSFSDDRGDFVKLYSRQRLPINHSIAQINFVRNIKANTFRGFHFQSGAAMEQKLFTCIRGAIRVYFIPLRTNSDNLIAGSVTLSSCKSSVLIPEHYATGYLTLEDGAEVIYSSNKPYQPELESGINFQDPALIVDWIGNESLFIVSDKDRNWPNYTANETSGS